MPRLRVNRLIDRLRDLVSNLHDIYVACNNLEIATALLQQIIHLEMIIAELMPLYGLEMPT